MQISCILLHQLTCSLFPAGLKKFAAVMCLLPRKKEPCVNALKDGNLLAISPGGTREALFSDENCRLIWHKRKGFAEVALDAKVVSVHSDCIVRVFGSGGGC